MSYRIKYTYDTGDSFSNTYGLEGYIECEFEDLQLAERNVQNIMEHYIMYQELNSYNTRSKGSNQDILEKYQEKEWFCKKVVPVVVLDNKTTMVISPKDCDKYRNKGLVVDYKYDEWACGYYLRLFLDGDKTIEYSTGSWCGYFESLVSVEIEETKPRLLKLHT